MSETKILRADQKRDVVAIVMGTRPSIVKMSPLVWEFEKRGIEYILIHTGQHYSYEMSRQFLEDLAVPAPHHHLPSSRAGAFHGEQTGHMLAGVERVLLEERPRLTLVCGDANTNLAAGLAARKLQIEVGHVESGLRSFDWRMPEEHNRIILDHISEHLFAPTDRTANHLQEDNVQGTIYVTGNTVVDALERHLRIAEEKSTVLEDLGLRSEQYLLATAHREETVDDPEVLGTLIESLAGVAGAAGMSVIFPIHPRTRKRIETFGLERMLERAEGLRLIDPLGYLDFLMLLANAQVVLTDSGGIQEESCILGVPCITLRESTERQESVEVGANRLAGATPEEVLGAFQEAITAARDWSNPYGDGRAAQRIADVVEGKTPEPFVFSEGNR